MHHLAAHTEHLLDTYNNSGLFSEDSMELDHAKVNCVASMFCTMTGEALMHPVLYSLSAQADQKLRNQKMSVIAKKKKFDIGEEVAAKDKKKR
jgi:hypothetical protein